MSINYAIINFMKKIFCLCLSFAAIVYSIYYATFGGFVGNSGALSKIGLTHPVLFIIWGMITCLALFYNLIVGYGKTKYKFYIPLLIIAFIGMVLTVTNDFDYSQRNDYLLHCIGSMTFSAVMGITVFLLFLLSKNYTFTIISGVILIGDLIFLIIFKETAIIELTPIFAGLIMLGIHNTRRERKAVEIK